MCSGLGRSGNKDDNAMFRRGFLKVSEPLRQLLW